MKFFKNAQKKKTQKLRRCQEKLGSAIENRGRKCYSTIHDEQFKR